MKEALATALSGRGNCNLGESLCLIAALLPKVHF